MLSRKLLSVALMVVLLGLASCGQEEDLPPTPTPSPAVTSTPADPTATPRPSPTPSPSPTPIPPALEADYQLVGDDGLLTIASITIPEDGWLVAYPDEQLELEGETALGRIAVTAGQTADLTLEIDPDWPERTIQLALHGGRAGDSFEPSADNLLLLQTVEIDTRQTVPAIEVADQEVMADGILTIARVFVPRQSWLAIFPAGGENDELSAADLLGYTPVRAGETTSVTVPIRWREAPTTLNAVLLADASPENVFDLEVDQLIAINGDRVEASFKAMFPPDIVILDQPLIENSFVVERAISDGDGWLVVYEDADEDGQPGFIIGSEPVKDGLNRDVIVNVNPAAVSTQLLVTLHDDTGDLGVFDFPGDDQPRRYQDQAFFTLFRTNTGPLLAADNQPLKDDDALTVALAVVDTDFWVVAQNDEEGRPGETVLGQVWLPAGFHRDITLPLESAAADGSTVHLLLYQDNGQKEEFERNLTDFPLQINRRLITVPVLIEPE